MTSSREVSEMWCLGIVGHGDFARILRVASVGFLGFFERLPHGSAGQFWQ